MSNFPSRPSRSRYRQSGRVISIVGPDGAGKSTLIEGLGRGILSEREVLSVRSVGVLPRRTGPSKGRRVVTEPHKDPPYNRFNSLIKLVYVAADYILGWFFRFKPLVARGGWVVIQRGWWDLCIDPLRYRLKISPKWLARLAMLLPKPDLLLVLEAQPEVILSRKQELTAAEVRRQTKDWRRLLPSSQRRVFLDAADSPDGVLAAAEMHIGRLLGGGWKAGWAALPNRDRVRWTVPRGPRQDAFDSLRIYHPMTPRGLAGWNAARLAAKLGAFRWLPRSESPAVLFEQHFKGPVLAVARCNHPGRFVVIAQDRGFRVVGKVATTEEGRAVLAREAEAIRKLGPALPEAIQPPLIVAEEPGLLALEQVLWMPRMRPWFLDRDLAGAMGRLFRSGGTTHGDFAPWNVLKTRNGWVLIDWEEARTEGPPLWDVFHYLTQAHALLGRPSSSKLLDGMRGSGWVGEALAAYATSAGLGSPDFPASFGGYLEQSRLLIPLETADGRKGREARDQLLSRL